VKNTHCVFLLVTDSAIIVKQIVSVGVAR